jgi:ribosome recycling factor
MTTNQIVDDVARKLKQAVEHFADDIKKLRTGRAHPSMLDSVMVVAYGMPTPLNQLSNITTPEAQLLQITPFDPSNVQAIGDAIRDDQSLGLNPSDDGRIVRVPVPPLNTERRQAIVKQLHEKTELCHIASRNIRHEALDIAKKNKNDKLFTEDDLNTVTKQVDALMAKTKTETEAIVRAKEQEIMTV